MQYSSKIKTTHGAGYRKSVDQPACRAQPRTNKSSFNQETRGDERQTNFLTASMGAEYSRRTVAFPASLSEGAICRRSTKPTERIPKCHSTETRRVIRQARPTGAQVELPASGQRSQSRLGKCSDYSQRHRSSSQKNCRVKIYAPVQAAVTQKAIEPVSQEKTPIEACSRCGHCCCQ